MERPDIEKPDPFGSGSSSSAREPTITFQRGTAADVSIAIWEDGQPIAGSNNLNMPTSMSRNNHEARMSAMRGSQAAAHSTRFARYYSPPNNCALNTLSRAHPDPCNMSLIHSAAVH